MRRTLPDWVLVLALVLLGLVPFVLAGATEPWLRRGALSWIVAVAVKFPVSAAVGMGLLLVRANPLAQGIVLGLLSAAAELGVAWFALEQAMWKPELPDVLAFAAAAGSVEALVLLGWGFFSRPDPDAVARWEASAESSWTVRRQFVVERGLAWFGHLGSRSLLALGWLNGEWWPGAIALVTFAVTDGLASYGQATGWDWSSAPILRRYYGVTAVIALIEIGLLALLMAIFS